MGIVDLGLLWLLVWILKNATVDVATALKGQPNPRYEQRKARKEAAGGRYGLGDWWADLLADGLQAQTRWRRERAEHRRGDREPVEVVDRPEPEAVEAPRPPAPAPPPAPPHAPTSANVLPFTRKPTTEPKESDPVATATAEVIGLDQSIAYATELGKHAREHGLAGNETYIGHLAAQKVTGTALSSAQEMQEAFDLAAAAAERHRDELAKQKGVQEQYDLVPDAGDKDFQTQGR